MRREVRVYIRDIIESISQIEEYIAGRNEEKFSRDLKTQDAVLRRLEIIGQAVKNIPAEFKTKYASVPWKKIAGTRDVISHDYSGVDFEEVWRVVQKDLPKLKKQMDKIDQALAEVA